MLRTIIWHSALEFLTFVLLFGVVTIVRWVIAPPRSPVPYPTSACSS